MKTVILTDPAHDIATTHLSYWIEVVVDHISSRRGMQAFRLRGSAASRKRLAEYVDKHNPRLLLLNGHGNDTCIAGYKDEPLVECGNTSINLCARRCIHSIACQAGQRLGKDIVAAGATAFIGYKEKFHFMHTSSKPLKSSEHDNIADLFLEPAYAVPKALVSGE